MIADVMPRLRALAFQPDAIYTWVTMQAEKLGFTDVVLTCQPQASTLALYFEIRGRFNGGLKAFHHLVAHEAVEHSEAWGNHQREILDKILQHMADYASKHANDAVPEVG